MPVDKDIKDAGALAGFVRWGWPWHGLCEGGVIGSSGKTISQPATGHAWLIDRGLPALDITPEEAAAELLEGRTWQNYGFISGGKVHGKSLPNDSYIHFDASGIPWLVTLTCTFPSTNVARVTASIVRFGLFDQEVGPQTPITMTEDVSCVLFQVYGGTLPLAAHIHDVFTNGSRAIYCVELTRIGITTGLPVVDVVSAIEIVFSGTGGVDGSGLVMAATEEKSQPVLTYFSSVATTEASEVVTGEFRGADGTLTGSIPCPDELEWFLTGLEPLIWPAGSGYNFPVGGGTIDNYCRYCFYDTGGVIVAASFRIKNTWEGVAIVTVSPYFTYPTSSTFCSTPQSHLKFSMHLDTTFTRSYAVTHNTSMIDEVRQNIHHDVTVDVSRLMPDGLSSDSYTTSYTKTRTWAGSITTGFPDIDLPPLNNLQDAWSDAGYSSAGMSGLDGTISIGILRTGHAHSFYKSVAGVRTYGIVGTPTGNKTTTMTAGFYYAWNRKTLDYAYSVNPICYV